MVISLRLIRLSRAACVAGVVATALFALPEFAEADDGDPPDHVVRAIRQGSEIEFLGEIGFGAAAELRKVLAANPNATVLHLNSPGGEILEAHGMAQAVHDRGLITTVDKSCVSACTLVLLAGRERVIAPGAQIGFHRPWVAGMSTAEIDTIDQQDRQYMHDHGVAQWFIDKAYATPNDSVWYPTETELTAAHVITGVNGRYLIAVGNYRGSIGGEIFVAQEFLEAAKERNPQRYQAMHEKMLQQLQQPASGDGLAIDGEFIMFLQSFMAHAEDKPIVAFLRVFSQIASDLASRNPDACYALLFPSQAPQGFDPHAAVGQDQQRQLIYAIFRAATNGAKNFLAVPSDDQVAGPLTTVFEAVRKAHPEDIPLLTSSGSSSDRGALCRAHAHVYAQIAALPDDQQGVLGRYLFASESHESGGSGGNRSSGSAGPGPSWPLNIHPDK